MSGEDCAHIRDLAPELALGIADGEQRAEALEHLAGCAECRAHLESLSAVADELLLLAPPLEPPVGFEDRFAARISPAPPSPVRRRRRFALAFAGVACVAAIAAAAVWTLTSSDRELASDYRAALARVDGNYFATGSLDAPGGREAGDVYAYDGEHSWVYVIASPPDTYPDGGAKLAPGRYPIELVGDSGRTVRMRPMEIGAGGQGSGGGELPAGLGDLNELRLLDSHGHEVAAATLEH
ncbi:MAG: zf-HC2 domain-containing protein [Solirubrobacterales bacterium]